MPGYSRKGWWRSQEFSIAPNAKKVRAPSARRPAASRHIVFAKRIAFPLKIAVDVLGPPEQCDHLIPMRRRREPASLANLGDQFADPLLVELGILGVLDPLVAKMNVHRAGVREGLQIVQNQAMPGTDRAHRDPGTVVERNRFVERHLFLSPRLTRSHYLAIDQDLHLVDRNLGRHGGLDAQRLAGTRCEA